MDDFDSFKASREKMDPTARKMSDHQWKQAYAAYRSARERVSGGDDTESSEEGGSSKSQKKRRRSSKSAAGRGAHYPSNISALGQLRRTVRDQSAYADLRLIIDLLSWIAIGVLVLTGVLTLFYYTSVAAAVSTLLTTVVQVIAVVVARLLAQVLIDIPDVALYRMVHEPASYRESSKKSDD
jgi:hypothetical protein